MNVGFDTVTVTDWIWLKPIHIKLILCTPQLLIQRYANGSLQSATEGMSANMDSVNDNKSGPFFFPELLVVKILPAPLWSFITDRRDGKCNWYLSAPLVGLVGSLH